MRSPYHAVWGQLDEETGEVIDRVLYVDDILQEISDGMSVNAIANAHEATREVIEHLIMMIPHMMVWRDSALPANIEGPQRLPR